jgi:hypothetical protein
VEGSTPSKAQKVTEQEEPDMRKHRRLQEFCPHWCESVWESRARESEEEVVRVWEEQSAEVRREVRLVGSQPSGREDIWRPLWHKTSGGHNQMQRNDCNTD